MKTSIYLTCYGLLLALTSCTSEEHYRLSANQLAWQPYQQGQVLRFGNRTTSLVRAYAVDKITDKEYNANAGQVAFVKRYYQEQEAFVQRTDTASIEDESAVRLAFNFHYLLSEQLGEDMVLAAVGWDNFNALPVPIDLLNSGSLPDTAAFNYLQVLTSQQLGTVTYPQVVRLRSYPGAPVTALYYAKGAGVVAFEEKKTGLWYRLP